MERGRKKNQQAQPEHGPGDRARDNPVAFTIILLVGLALGALQAYLETPSEHGQLEKHLREVLRSKDKPVPHSPPRPGDKPAALPIRQPAPLVQERRDCRRRD